MIKSATWSAVSGSAERTRMNDGLVWRRTARRVPKSVSWETMIRSSVSARSRISSSVASCSPTSRTATASWPTAVSRPATRGDRLASTNESHAWRVSGSSRS